MSNTRKVTKHNRSEAWDEVLAAAKADAEESPPTASCHERAAQAVAAPDLGLLGARGERVLGSLVLALAVVVVVLAMAGCVSEGDRRLLDLGVSVNMGHAADESLPIEARLIALDNADSHAALRLSLTGDELPPATRARYDAYRRALEGADPGGDVAPIDTRDR